MCLPLGAFSPLCHSFGRSAERPVRNAQTNSAPAVGSPRILGHGESSASTSIGAVRVLVLVLVCGRHAMLEYASINETKHHAPSVGPIHPLPLPRIRSACPRPTQICELLLALLRVANGGRRPGPPSRTPHRLLGQSSSTRGSMYPVTHTQSPSPYSNIGLFRVLCQTHSWLCQAPRVVEATFLLAVPGDPDPSVVYPPSRELLLHGGLVLIRRPRRKESLIVSAPAC